MIFSAQRYIEDVLATRGMNDLDNYAIRAANALDVSDLDASEVSIQLRLSGIRTNLFRVNRAVNRSEFEILLARALRSRFRHTKSPSAAFHGSLAPVRARLKTKKRSIKLVLTEFKRAVEGRAVDSFWQSRKSGVLRPRPEVIGQGLLAVFAQSVIGTHGAVLREFASGIGFVDVGITFTGIIHLVELKVLDGAMKGVSQLGRYMETENRRVGWLLLLDVRPARKKAPTPASVRVSEGQVRIIVVDLNPTPPHEA